MYLSNICKECLIYLRPYNLLQLLRIARKTSYMLKVFEGLIQSSNLAKITLSSRRLKRCKLTNGYLF